jgi:hypothetical protein
VGVGSHQRLGGDVFGSCGVSEDATRQMKGPSEQFVEHALEVWFDSQFVVPH